MYCLSDTQIDFILGDISARGIGMESLQQNLLDHICCVIEHNLEADGDFEVFYRQTIATFYEVELKEIEVETVNLLTHKNYYIMKKIMIASGALSVGTLSVGILFKFMHWPGAAIILFFGVIVLSFVFLPLMFTLKVKEKQQRSDKIVSGIGTLAAMLISVGILFKIMHWPGANALCIGALALMIVVFIPVYFFSGIRNPVTKVNTIVSSVLLLSGCSLILVLIRSPHGTKSQYISDTDYFLRNEQIVKNEQRQIARLPFVAENEMALQGFAISKRCDALKAFLLQRETGFETLDHDFESKDAYIGDTFVMEYFSDPSAQQQLADLQKRIQQYNAIAGANVQRIPATAVDFNQQDRVRTALNDLVQVQMIVLQNQRELAVN